MTSNYDDLQCCPVLVPQSVWVCPYDETENLESMQFVTIGVVDDSGWDESKVSKSNRSWHIESSILQTWTETLILMQSLKIYVVNLLLLIN